MKPSRTEVTGGSAVTGVGDAPYRMKPSRTEVAGGSAVTGVGDAPYHMKPSRTEVAGGSAVMGVGDAPYRMKPSRTEVAISALRRKRPAPRYTASQAVMEGSRKQILHSVHVI
jgi:hypothetical protein